MYEGDNKYRNLFGGSRYRCCFHGGRAPEVHCYATPIYKLGKCSRTNFFALLLPQFFEIHIFGFPCSCNHEDLSIDVSITNVALILTKLRFFQLLSTSQNSISNFFEKKIKFLSFHDVWCRTREDLSIDVSITNVGLIFTKLW